MNLTPMNDTPNNSTPMTNTQELPDTKVKQAPNQPA